MKRLIIILITILTVSICSNSEMTELNQESQNKIYFSENSSGNSSEENIVYAVDMQCLSPNPSGSVEVPVYPGSTLTGFANCIVTNPNSFTVRIIIEADADGLAVAAPGTITLASNGESEFQTTVQADQRMTMSARSLVVTATVVEANGSSPSNTAESQVHMIISILQYSGIQVESVNSFVEMDAGSEIELEFKVYNQGNGADFFSISFENKNDTNGLEISSDVSKINIDATAVPERVALFVVAPDELNNWTTDSDGNKFVYSNIEFTATSVFSCQSETSGCNSMSQLVTIKIYQNYTAAEEQSSTAEESATESCSDEVSSAKNSVLLYGGIANIVFILLVFVLMITMKKSQNSSPDIPFENHFPSATDAAQRFDENGYEWFTAQDGTNFYRTIGSQADWTMLEN